MLTMNMKQMFMGLLPKDKTAIYTVPSGNLESVIKDLMIYNPTTDKAIELKMYINDVLFVNQTIAPKDTLFAHREWTIVLKPNDKISFETSVGDTLQALLSGAETKNVED